MNRTILLILLTLTLVACGRTPAAGTSVALPTRAATASPFPSPGAASAPTQVSPAASPTMPTRTAVSTFPPTPTPTPTPTPQVALRDQDGMAMVFVPAGDFIMGNLLGIGSDEEAPPHRVSLDGYWIDRTEVTNAQYRTFVEATGHRAPALCKAEDQTYADGEKTEHPVVCVSWDDAHAYCAWAGGRLPTEAEWEKAARGLDQRTYPWGSRFDGSRANYCDASCELEHKDSQFDDGYARTAPVGSYPSGASLFGALDMAGNVWEWVGDWYSFTYYSRSPEINPPGPGIGDARVVRGGAWNSIFENLRSAFRGWLAPEQGDRVIGFRCVLPTQPTP